MILKAIAIVSTGKVFFAQKESPVKATVCVQLPKLDMTSCNPLNRSVCTLHTQDLQFPLFQEIKNQESIQEMKTTEARQI